MIQATICKLYPTKAQEKILGHNLDVALDCWNTYVDRMSIAGQENTDYGKFRWKKILTNEKKPEWNSVNRSILNRVIAAISSGIQATLTKRAKAKYFKNPKRREKYEKVEFPKKKDRITWFKLENGFELKFDKDYSTGILNLIKPGKGVKRGSGVAASIPFRGSRNLPGKLCDEITITKRNNGWFLIILHDVPDNFYTILDQPNDITGYDWGLNTFLVSDSGEEFKIPQFQSNREMKNIENLYKKLKQQKKGSRRSKKTGDHISNLEQRAVRRKKDFYYRLATELTSKSKIICIEELGLDNIKQKKNRHGKAMDKQSSGIFFSILDWIAKKQGCKIIKVNPWMTSKTCSDCGHLKGDLRLSDREWTCPNCGCYHNRDQNSAINIKNLALFTLRIRGSAREVLGKYPSIQDCFQSIGIKREVNQDLKVERG